MNFEGKHAVYRDSDGGGGFPPRHPTPREVAQAILTHAEEILGHTPSTFNTSFEEIYDPKHAKSTIRYWGLIGFGSFDLPWPRVPIDPSDTSASKG